MAATTYWKRSTWTDAGQLAAAIDADAAPADAAGQPLPAWFARLRDGGDHPAALAFLAHALPRYECVVWAARSLLDLAAIDRADPAAVAVLRWIDDPEDGTRRAAGAAADAMRRATPAKLLAQAVFFSGGSIAPPDLPPVQPPPGVCARLAAGAVLMGAHARPGPAAALRTALDIGEAIANGE